MKKFVFLCLLFPSFVFASPDDDDMIYHLKYKKMYLGCYIQDEDGNQAYVDGKPMVKTFPVEVSVISSIKDKKTSEE